MKKMICMAALVGLVASVSAHANEECRNLFHEATDQTASQDFRLLPLAQKISKLQELEEEIEKSPTFIGYAGLPVREINSDKASRMLKQRDLARSLIGEIIDADSFLDVINYLGRKHPTTFKYDQQPFSLSEALERGDQLLQKQNPGFDTAIKMLNGLSFANADIASQAMQGYVIFSEGVRKIYLYAIDNVRTPAEARQLIKLFAPFAESGLFPVFAGKGSVLTSLVERTQNLLAESPAPVGITRLGPNESALRSLVAEINFAKAKTPNDFILAVPLVIDPSNFIPKDRSEENMATFEPSLKKYMGKFFEMNPSPEEIMGLIKKVSSNREYPRPSKWSTNSFFRKFARKNLAPYITSPEDVTNLMNQLKAKPAAGYSSAERMEVLFLLQNSIPTRLQSVFLSGLKSALPTNVESNDLKALLEPYRGDRELETLASTMTR